MALNAGCDNVVSSDDDDIVQSAPTGTTDPGTPMGVGECRWVYLLSLLYLPVTWTVHNHDIIHTHTGMGQVVRILVVFKKSVRRIYFSRDTIPEIGALFSSKLLVS